MGIAPVLERQTIPEAVSRIRGVRVFRRPDQRPYPKSSRSGRLHRLSLDVSDRQRADGTLAVPRSPRRIRRPGDVSEITGFLRTITPETLFDPRTWTRLPAFARVIPDGDILPTRATYSLESNDYQVALNHVYARTTIRRMASGMRCPIWRRRCCSRDECRTIVDAFRIGPEGSFHFRPITLRGAVPIDPRRKTSSAGDRRAQASGQQSERFGRRAEAAR